MSITSYTTLLAAVNSDYGWLHRDDLDDRMPEFVQLTESALQVRCKILDFETSATVTVTSGTGTLPTDWVGARSLYWSGDLAKPLTYITPDRFDALRNDNATPSFYTITGTSLKVAPSASGDLVATYLARFTPISASNETNVLITRFPDVYLWGVMTHASLYLQDDAAYQKYGQLFSGAIDRINTDNQERKYAGPLQVRAR